MTKRFYGILIFSLSVQHVVHCLQLRVCRHCHPVLLYNEMIASCLSTITRVTVALKCLKNSGKQMVSRSTFAIIVSRRIRFGPGRSCFIRPISLCKITEFQKGQSVTANIRHKKICRALRTTAGTCSLICEILLNFFFLLKLFSRNG